MQKSKKRFLISLAGMMAAICVMILGIQSKTDFISVSNTVNGKELPIYSVDTDEKKVAISFDAAWGDG